METFETELMNKRQASVAIWDRNGDLLLNLAPGQTHVLESAHPRTLFAQYSKIVFELDGLVSLSERSGWVDPYSAETPWKVVFENRDGKNPEERQCGGQYVCVSKGIPVPCFVSALAPEAKYARVIIKRVEVEERSTVWQGYLAEHPEIQDIPEERSEKEMKLVLADREALMKKIELEKDNAQKNESA